MKVLAGLQAILAAFAGYEAWSLWQYKRFVPLLYDFGFPPDLSNHHEFLLLISGLLIVILALVQLTKHFMLARLQVVLGQDIVILSIVLFIFAQVFSWPSPPELLWIIFGVIALAVLVIAVSIIQIFIRAPVFIYYSYLVMYLLLTVLIPNYTDGRIFFIWFLFGFGFQIILARWIIKQTVSKPGYLWWYSDGMDKFVLGFILLIALITTAITIMLLNIKTT